MLTTADHRRDSAGMTHVYPVVSRRAGGVSIGVNLNVNNACNWACVYCQVEGLKRGAPPPVDLGRLRSELCSFLDRALHGDFMESSVAPGFRRLADVAFSGNGEPTSAPEFAQAVEVVRCALAERSLLPEVKIRLITNGSLLHRAAVQEGVRAIGAAGGEVWFKIDRFGEAASRAVNGVRLAPAQVLRRLALCAGLAPTWVQTCWFASGKDEPGAAEREAYCTNLAPLAGRLEGVHLYGLARPSLQPGGERLRRLDAAALGSFAAEIETRTGIRVLVSP